MKRDFDSIDILVNNAAIAFKGSDPTPFAQQAWPTINTNYFGTLRLTEGLLPLIEKSTRSPRIVNVASSAGHLRILTSKVPAQWTRWMNNILWWILFMQEWKYVCMNVYGGEKLLINELLFRSLFKIFCLRYYAYRISAIWWTSLYEMFRGARTVNAAGPTPATGRASSEWLPWREWWREIWRYSSFMSNCFWYVCVFVFMYVCT